MVYTDGSKMEEDVGYGWAICSGDSSIVEYSGNLGPNSTVFQAEVYAIGQALKWINSNPRVKNTSTIQVLSDSQSAIKAIFGRSVSSQTVEDTINELEIAQTNYTVAVDWVKGHNDCTGNELADALAKAGTLKHEIEEVTIPTSNIKSKIKDHINEMWQTRWDGSAMSKHTREILPKVDHRRLKVCRKLSNKDLTLLSQTVTGHGLFKAHLKHWNDLETECELCLEDEETAVHWWRDCPALEYHRQQCQTLMEGKNILKQLLFFYNSCNPITINRRFREFGG